MESGDSLNPGFFFEEYEPYGYVLNQGALALQLPESNSLYYLFHMDVNLNEAFTNTQPENFYLSIIDLSFNNGLGRVIEKNNALTTQLLDTGKITAVKHANGRDWWIVIRDFYSNQYRIFSLSLEGVQLSSTQIVGDSIPSGSLGQAVFSPDGSKYVQTNLHGSNGVSATYVNIYDFDRCSSELSNPIQFSYDDSAACLGAAISPNSRFLYVSSWVSVYQYDLWAEDIEASRITVAEWDGFADEGIFSNTFYLAQLAPNGKIYINSNNGTKHLHVINQPDSLGLACEVCQHCVELPSWNSFSMPNFPNYRLGHEEGSTCDTLRQLPTAAWSYESGLLEVSFQNESMHDIRSYAWNFGDGATSQLPHPQHSYEQPGTYEVCLVVSNLNGSDSLCENVSVMTTGMEEVLGEANGLSVFPNPLGNTREVNVSVPVTQHAASLILTNSQGLIISEWLLGKNLRTFVFSMNDQPPGLYFLQWSSRQKVYKSKLIITR
jgi:PKD repeat protein